MVNLAIALIILAIVMFALGLAKGATILFWFGLGIALLSLLIWASSGRRDPPV